jgi:hypothetical protein
LLILLDRPLILSISYQISQLQANIYRKQQACHTAIFCCIFYQEISEISSKASWWHQKRHLNVQASLEG